MTGYTDRLKNYLKGKPDARLEADSLTPAQRKRSRKKMNRAKAMPSRRAAREAEIAARVEAQARDEAEVDAFFGSPSATPEISDVEKAALSNPEVMAAVGKARSGDRTGVRARVPRDDDSDPPITGADLNNCCLHEMKDHSLCRRPVNHDGNHRKQPTKADQ